MSTNRTLNLLKASQTIEAVSEGRQVARREKAELQVAMQSSAVIEIRGVNRPRLQFTLSIATLQSEPVYVEGAGKCGEAIHKMIS